MLKIYDIADYPLTEPEVQYVLYYQRTHEFQRMYWELYEEMAGNLAHENDYLEGE